MKIFVFELASFSDSLQIYINKNYHEVYIDLLIKKNLTNRVFVTRSVNFYLEDVRIHMEAKNNLKTLCQGALNNKFGTYHT